MASSLSLGLFSTFVPSKTASLRPPSLPRVSLRVPAAANLRRVRTVAKAAPEAAEAATSKREPRGIMKPKRVSQEMQDFLGGVAEIPRTQALKEIWAYIKQHDLQDPENKKVIVCDDELKKIFAGKDRVGFLEIAGLISPHFLK